MPSSLWSSGVFQSVMQKFLKGLKGIQYDRFQHSVIVTADDLTFHDTFPPLHTIRSGLSRIQVHMQPAFVERTGSLRGTVRDELEQSQ